MYPDPGFNKEAGKAVLKKNPKISKDMDTPGFFWEVEQKHAWNPAAVRAAAPREGLVLLLQCLFSQYLSEIMLFFP